MLYGEETPLVGVGLLYKPHYLSTEPFSAAYMHLHVWHAVASNRESANRLSSSRLIFINVSKMSDMIPVEVQHPVLLDVATKDNIMSSGEPMSPHTLRGFRLHMVWHGLPGEDPVHQVTIPHFQGETNSSMLEYEPEKLPQDLKQGPKMAVNLRPPSRKHWNIASDLVLPVTIDNFRWWRKARHAEQDPEGRSVGAEGSPKETPAPGKTPQVVAGGSKAALLKKAAHPGKRTMETALGILEHIHALCLQALHDIGAMRKLEHAVVHTLMAEFARLQLILCEDLTKSLLALCSELETSSKALSSDLLGILSLHSGDPAFLWVKKLIQKYHQSVSLKVNLPLIELKVTREDQRRSFSNLFIPKWLKMIRNGQFHPVRNFPPKWLRMTRNGQIHLRSNFSNLFNQSGSK